jgi:mannitol/fructose-specific phosphotransferase system IIA component (Ntr-type)
MNISDFLDADKILLHVHGTSKAEITDQLIDLFADDERIRDLQKMREAVHAREGIMSTAVGNGFAIPHAKTEWVSDIVMACGLLDKPIDFEAPDGRAVELVFLVVCNEDKVSSYVQIISRIATIMNSDGLAKRLAGAQSPEEVFDLLHKEEERIGLCKCTRGVGADGRVSA